jgi:hypothetical protein
MTHMKKEFPGEYPDNWKEIAKAVKDTAEWKCVRCGREHNPKEGYCLTVHHLDGHKDNCAWWNIPALCQRCHLHIQGKVVMERPYMFAHTPWFLPYVGGYYAKQKGVVKTKDYYQSLAVLPREYVLEHIEELLILPFGE